MELTLLAGFVSSSIIFMAWAVKHGQSNNCILRFTVFTRCARELGEEDGTAVSFPWHVTLVMKGQALKFMRPKLVALKSPIRDLSELRVCLSQLLSWESHEPPKLTFSTKRFPFVSTSKGVQGDLYTKGSFCSPGAKSIQDTRCKYQYYRAQCTCPESQLEAGLWAFGFQASSPMPKTGTWAWVASLPFDFRRVCGVSQRVGGRLRPPLCFEGSERKPQWSDFETTPQPAWQVCCVSYNAWFTDVFHAGMRVT